VVQPGKLNGRCHKDWPIETGARQTTEKLDEVKRSKNQRWSRQWAESYRLLGANKLNLADALAWQRDAARQAPFKSRCLV
jgi:hypothetical protein